MKTERVMPHLIKCLRNENTREFSLAVIDKISDRLVTSELLITDDEERQMTDSLLAGSNR